MSIALHSLCCVMTGCVGGTVLVVIVVERNVVVGLVVMATVVDGASVVLCFVTACPEQRQDDSGQFPLAQLSEHHLSK